MAPVYNLNVVIPVSVSLKLQSSDDYDENDFIFYPYLQRQILFTLGKLKKRLGKNSKAYG